MGFNIGDIILYMVVFLFSLTLHEVGHAWTSEKFGDPTSRYLGRISLNPLVHIDPLGTIILPLIGAFTGAPVIGWAKPVPVNPLLWKDKVTANIVVSAAGPIANMLIAGVSLIILKILLMQQLLVFGSSGNRMTFVQAATPSYILDPLGKMLCMFVILNISLAIFNLLPIPPLDGSHILSSILSIVSPSLMEAYEGLRPYGMMLLIGFVMINNQVNILGPIFRPVFKAIGFFLDF